MVSEADGFNSLRAKATVQADVGNEPNFFIKPKRKRAFHRAIKRGENWAITEKCYRDLANNLAQQFYTSIMKPSPFLDLLKFIKRDKK